MPSWFLPHIQWMAGLLLVGMLLLTGCARSLQPVGMPLEKAPDHLNGVWVHPKGELEVQCDAAGKLTAVYREAPEDGEPPEVETMEGVLLQMGAEDFHVANLKDPEAKAAGYVFALVSLEDEEELILWHANLDTVTELVKNGKLAGEVGKYDVQLTGEGPAIAQVLIAEGLETSFVWEKPLVFSRKK